jgi:hypothetical protein
VTLRCYRFHSSLGEVFRWYEELGNDRMRAVLVFGEYKTGHWRMRGYDDRMPHAVDVFDRRGDVERVC